MMTELEREIFNKGLKSELAELKERIDILQTLAGAGGTPASEPPASPVHARPRATKKNGKYEPNDLMLRASAVLATGGENPLNIKDVRAALEQEGLQFDNNRQLGQALGVLGRGGFIKKKAKGYIFKKPFTPEAAPAQEGIVMP